MRKAVTSVSSHQVLLVHQDEGARRQIEAWLSDWGYEVLVASSIDAAGETLRRDDAPRLALLGMTGGGGGDVLALCHELRRRPTEHYVYVALVGERGSTIDLQTCIDADVDDYVEPPIDARVLRLHLEAGRRVARLQDELVAARKAVESRASCDALTGVANRATALAGLEREVVRARRENDSVAMMITDVDHFKRVNDQLGHPVGDIVLREIALRMTRIVRPYDLLGRYGGEEFICVMPGCDRAGAVAAAERVVDLISREPIGLPTGPLRVTVSIGVSASGLETPYDMEKLIQAADAALYRAKHAGRNRVEVDIDDKNATTMDLARELGETARVLISDLVAAIAVRDVKAVRARSRLLRRIGGDLSAKGVVHITRTLEARADAGHWDAARAAVDAIAGEIARLAPAAQTVG
jgi:diguanylate cyclase (GGDEF)-like protein